METRRSIVAIAVFWGLVLMGTQALCMREYDLPVDKEIFIRIKKIEDKDKLEKACQQNNHRLIDRSSLLERSFLIEIPPDDAKKIFEDYKKLDFVEFAWLSDISTRGIMQRHPNLANYNHEAAQDSPAFQVLSDAFHAYSPELICIHRNWQGNRSARDFDPTQLPVLEDNGRAFGLQDHNLPEPFPHQSWLRRW